MGDLKTAVKEEAKEFASQLTLIASIVTVIGAFSGQIANIWASNISLSLCAVGLFFFVQNILAKLKVNSSPSKLRLLIALRRISFLALAVPVCFFLKYIYDQKRVHCSFDQNNLGLIISNFQRASDDDFSYKLFSLLSDRLSSVDSINIIKTAHFFDLNSSKSLNDSLSKELQLNCLNHGLIVFGKRNRQNQMFDCKIFLQNFWREGKMRAGSGEIIYLQNPDLIEFSIENQAKAVSEFILGLFFYHANQFDRATLHFKNAIPLDSTSRNSQYLAKCRFFLGNSLARQKLYKEAITQYEDGIAYQIEDALLFYNLGIVRLFEGDSVGAIKAMKLSHKLDSTLPDYSSMRLRVINEPNQVVKISAPKTIPADMQHGNAIQKSTRQQELPRSKEFTVIVNAIGKYGILNSKGDTIVPLIYDQIQDEIYIYNNKRFFIVNRNGKFGALDQRGNTVIPIVHPSSQYVKFVIKITQDDDSSKIKIQM